MDRIGLVQVILKWHNRWIGAFRPSASNFGR